MSGLFDRKGIALDQDLIILIQRHFQHLIDQVWIGRQDTKGLTEQFDLKIDRQAGRPSTTGISKRMIELRGSPTFSFEEFSILNRKVNAALSSKFRRGVVRKCGRVQGDNRAVLWEVIG